MVMYGTVWYGMYTYVYTHIYIYIYILAIGELQNLDDTCKTAAKTADRCWFQLLELMQKNDFDPHNTVPGPGGRSMHSSGVFLSHGGSLK
jgi:hypothetical protein